MNSPKLIANIRYSIHARLRMSERGITKKRVAQALELGELTFESTKWKLVHESLTVYFSKDGASVVTLFEATPSTTSKEEHQPE